MYAVIAEAVDVSVEQLELALAEEPLLRELALSRSMSVEEMVALADSAYHDLVLKSLACGLLNREQVDNLLACRKDRMASFFDCLRPAGGYREMLHTAAARALDMNLDDLELEFHNGLTLRQVAESRGSDISEVRTAMKQVHRDQIRQAVNGGDLSSAQARQIQEQML